MKQILSKVLIIFAILSSPRAAKADLWGGDVVVLGKILIQSIQQLIQLKKILSTTREEMQSFRELHAGINEALDNFRSLDPFFYKGVFDDFSNLERSISEIQKIYGKPNSKLPNFGLLENTDQLIAESILRQNKVFDYSVGLTNTATDIESLSKNASPKGAARLSAQGISLMLKALSEDLRLNSAQVKLKSSQIAKENAHDKKHSELIFKGSEKLSQKLQDEKSSFQIPKL